MAKKHFNKTLPHYCQYCIYGTCSEYSNEVLCVKKGITNINDSCHKYKYDPLKREPLSQRLNSNYSDEDFLL